MRNAEEQLSQVLAAYDFPAPPTEVLRYGSGHINDTFCVRTQLSEQDGPRFILQRINRTAFPRPRELMENMLLVTAFLKEALTKNGEDPTRGTLQLRLTREGQPYCLDADGALWRLTDFVENTYCLQRVEHAQQFYASARAFGRFQRLLGDFPADQLHETISRFHDTEHRLHLFRRALEADKLGRAAEVRPEIDFILARAADCSVCMQALRDGVLPLRVTHNDTKLNNVLFDRATDEGICIVDLDTVMPGLSINDFGDSIRFGANHSAEDEQDLSRVCFDLPLYEAYTRGFLEEAAPVLTDAELEYMPWGAKLMTLECGMRFLTDYLEGDVYFRVQRPGQNLDRCRTQLKLVADMEAHWQQMHQIIRDIAAKARP